jgi:hypothetical protein
MHTIQTIGIIIMCSNGHSHNYNNYIGVFLETTTVCLHHREQVFTPPISAQ